MATLPEIKKTVRNPFTARGAALFAASLVVGGLTGLAIEGHTNDVAAGKEHTATTCLEITPHETTITEQLDACLEQGVPGGRKIGAGVFKVGQPVVLVEQYADVQAAEAARIELARVAGWSVAPSALAALSTTIDL